MIEFDARIDIFCGRDGFEINIHDDEAGIKMLALKMTPENFTAALGRLAHAKCESAKAYGLELVGKAQEREAIEFVVPDLGRHDSDELKRVASKLAEEYCAQEKPGWKPDNYYNSRDSFFRKDGLQYARTFIRRWVEKPKG